jgi:hypothetical protein
MKLLFWIGVLSVAIGLISFVVPIPHKERERFSGEGMFMGVTNQHSQTISPIISVVMILGGAGMIFADRNRK